MNVKKIPIKNNVKELIDRLDPMKLKCLHCKKWKDSEEVKGNLPGYQCYCIDCWEKS